MQDIYSFLKDLKKNNNREWFHANKERYLEVKRMTEDFAQRLINIIATIEPEAAMLTPADCTYRIYRDTRFSLDKTPYKTHIGIFVCPGGNKKSSRPGYYIHMEPGNSFIGGGCWCPPAPLLKEIRQSIYDNIEEYLEIIENPDFKQHYIKLGDNLLKTAPKGFPKDWEYIDLLKPRDYTVLAPVKDSLITSPKALDNILPYIKSLHPLNAFMNYIFEEHPELKGL